MEILIKGEDGVLVMVSVAPLTLWHVSILVALMWQVSECLSDRPSGWQVLASEPCFRKYLAINTGF